MLPTVQKFVRTQDAEYVVTEKNAEYGKVTGTRLGGLLGMSKWDTPFSVTAKLLRLFNEDISDKKEVHAGSVIESKILDYVGALHGEDVFNTRSGDHEDWESDFQDEIFGGHIDGLMPDGAVVEVKTTKNPGDWKQGPPTHYWLQASLYAHFLKTDRIVFLVGFTDDDILANPEGFVASEKTVARYDVPIIDGFDGMLKKAEEIYRATVLQNTTTIPDPTNPIDSRIMDALDCQLWTEEKAADAVERMVGLQAEVDRVKAYEKQLQTSKEIMALYMRTRELDVVNGRTCDIRMNKSNRSTIDTDALKRDGIYDIYTKSIVVESMRIVKKR